MPGGTVICLLVMGRGSSSHLHPGEESWREPLGGWVLWGGKGGAGGHHGAFVMCWDRPNLGSRPRTGKNSLYTASARPRVRFCCRRDHVFV